MMGPSKSQTEAALAKRRKPANTGRIVKNTTPYRILAQLRKNGPMGYRAISDHISGVRMLRRDKYVDPSLHSLKYRGFIVLSRATGDGRWTITPEGRLALRDALPDQQQIADMNARERERIASLHQAHIELQRKLGIPEALIHEPLPGATYTAAV